MIPHKQESSVSRMSLSPKKQGIPEDIKQIRKNHPKVALIQIYVNLETLFKGVSPNDFGELVERETGFEPATSTLARLHSTTELFPHQM